MEKTPKTVTTNQVVYASAIALAWSAFGVGMTYLADLETDADALKAMFDAEWSAIIRYMIVLLAFYYVPVWYSKIKTKFFTKPQQPTSEA